MDNVIVRIASAEIKNFKNVTCGYLSFENPKCDYQASILGLYGQNGSGKTALIEALALLRFALSGKRLPPQFANYISIESDRATLTFEFKITNKTEPNTYSIFYEFSLGKEVDEHEHNAEQISHVPTSYRATIFDEVLSFKSHHSQARLQTLMDTKTNEVFGPLSKYHILVGKCQETKTNLLVAKKFVTATSRSFVFSQELLSVVRRNCKEQTFRTILESLVYFGNFELFIINTASYGLISLEALPLAFKYEEAKQLSAGSLILNLNKPSTIPEDTVVVAKKVIANMNIVLKQLLPGLTIDLKVLSTEFAASGEKMCSLQLMSKKDQLELPLGYESEGIKKIISVLNLLIGVYNKSSMTCAIDELDSGIFEYLLGELLKIITEKGQGQLIFTSHNLRPLETINKGFVAFTTSNPKKRYTRMNNVKTCNNLRDFYYRDILLGQQNQPLYDPTNNYEIALAFREAGQTND